MRRRRAEYAVKFTPKMLRLLRAMMIDYSNSESRSVVVDVGNIRRRVERVMDRHGLPMEKGR